MRVQLNRYGLVAFACGSTTSIELVCERLRIRLDTTDSILLRDAVQREENRVGFYNGSMLLCSVDNLQFFHEPSSDLTKRIIGSFSSGKGCAVYQFSIPDVHGYAYFEEGQSLRIKHGSVNEVWVDCGNALAIEALGLPIVRLQEELVEQVTGEELPELLGRDIRMFRFDAVEYP
jgi:hypothetical protein